MIFLKKRKHFISISFLLIISACSSQQEIISVSQAHLYNNNYGIIQDPYSEELLKREEFAMNLQEIDKNSDKEFTPEKGTFLAEDYVQPPEVITYKYKFDPKFYSKAEWRSMP